MTTASATVAETAAQLRRAGQLAGARRAYREFAAAAEAAGDGPGFVEAALGIGGIWVHEHRDTISRAEVAALWERATDLAAPGSIEAARLTVRRAAEAVYLGGPVDAVGAAVSEIQRFGDDGATAEALSLLHHVCLAPDAARTRLEIADEIVAIAARAGDELWSLMGLVWRAVDLFLLGNPRADQALADLLTAAAARNCEALSYVGDVLNAMVTAREGRLEEAVSAAEAACNRGTEVGDPDAPAYFGAVLAAVRRWQGRPGEVLPLVRTLSCSPQLGFNDHVYIAADATLSACAGDVEGGQEALARLAAIGLDRLPGSSSWLTALSLTTEAGYLLGDAPVAAEAARLIAPFADLPVMPSIAVVCLGSVRYYLGLAAAVNGDLDLAVIQLEAGIAMARQLRNRPMATIAEHTLSAVLAARSEPGDGDRAEALQARAAGRAERLGMVLEDHPAWLEGATNGRDSAVHEASLAQMERGWRLTVDGRVTSLADRVGLGYLAALVNQPGRDIDAVALAAGSWSGQDHPEPVIDTAARRSYQRRSRELRSSLESGGLDPKERARVQSELDALTRELRADLGLSGRVRAFPTSQERARTSVRKAILRAIDSLAEIEPALSEHLRRSTVTGATCRYEPTGSWHLDARF